MKRTVFHISKLFNTTANLQQQPPSMFPFLNSQAISHYAKSEIRFKKLHAQGNQKNINDIVPYTQAQLGKCHEIIFFGRSNVGKSTLLNCLMQEPVAAVSKRPGKTKQLLFCELKAYSLTKNANNKVFFIDAPGYGHAQKVSKSEIRGWGKLITSYLKRTQYNKDNQNILCLLDINHGLKETDALVFNMLKSMNKNFQIIFTKCDKMNDQDRENGFRIAKKIQEEYQDVNFYVHFTSCREMTGVDELRNHIAFQIFGKQI